MLENINSFVLVKSFSQLNSCEFLDSNYFPLSLIYLSIYFMQSELRYHYANNHFHLAKPTSQDFSNTQWIMSFNDSLKNSVNPTPQGEHDHLHNGILIPIT